MTKLELIKDIATRADMTKDMSGRFLNAFIDSITDTLSANEKVSIIGFGTFDITERSARMGRNPQTGEEMMLSASRCPRFKAAKNLKDAVNC